MKFIGRKLLKIALIIAAGAALGAAVMLLWNAVIPGLLVGTRQIDYWHALGLLALSRILFGGFRGHCGRHERRHWKRWQSMTQEERDQFLRSKSWGYRKNEEQA